MCACIRASVSARGLWVWFPVHARSAALPPPSPLLPFPLTQPPTYQVISQVEDPQRLPGSGACLHAAHKGCDTLVSNACMAERHDAQVLQPRTIMQCTPVNTNDYMHTR
eukprot:1143406-Pelagomonas_calceolata.AAC.3